MDQSRIFKYQFEESKTLEGNHALLIPWGKVVHVGAQYPIDTLPTVWVEHTEEQIAYADKQLLLMYGTGKPIEIPLGRVHLGTAICAEGELVWHVYGFRQ